MSNEDAASAMNLQMITINININTEAVIATDYPHNPMDATM